MAKPEPDCSVPKELTRREMEQEKRREYGQGLSNPICPNLLHSLGDAPSGVPRMQSYCSNARPTSRIAPGNPSFRNPVPKGNRGQMLLPGKAGNRSLA